MSNVLQILMRIMRTYLMLTINKVFPNHEKDHNKKALLALACWLSCLEHCPVPQKLGT